MTYRIPGRFSLSDNPAERERFELSVPRCGTTVFETAPFDRSGTSPGLANSYAVGDTNNFHDGCVQREASV